jgi:uncharacterized protein
MKIEFDPVKDEKNQQEHGLSLADVHLLDWDHAIYRTDERKEYGEERIQAFAYGLKDKKPYAVVLTIRGERVRIISFRRANKREERLILKERNTHDEESTTKKGDKKRRI